jgi:hypothetical protein
MGRSQLWCGLMSSGRMSFGSGILFFAMAAFLGDGGPRRACTVGPSYAAVCETPKR